MIEVRLEKFLLDYIENHQCKKCEIQIRDLNKCIDEMRKHNIHVNFYQPELSLLINKNEGHLFWENGKIMYDEIFVQRLKEYDFNIDPEGESTYNAIIKWVDCVK